VLPARAAGPEPAIADATSGVIAAAANHHLRLIAIALLEADPDSGKPTALLRDVRTLPR
jgi:hypothetical protein